MEINACMGCGALSYRATKCPVCERTAFQKMEMISEADLTAAAVSIKQDAPFVFPLVEITSRVGKFKASDLEEFSERLLQIGATIYTEEILSELKCGGKMITVGNRITGSITVRVLDSSSTARKT